VAVDRPADQLRRPLRLDEVARDRRDTVDPVQLVDRPRAREDVRALRGEHAGHG